jgi:hypothetical protein
VTLDVIKLLDKNTQSGEMDIFFFNEDPTAGVSADKDTVDITDVVMETCAGVVTMFSTDYSATASNSFGNVRNIGLEMLSDTGNFWIVVVTRDTPNYGAGAVLEFKFDFTFNFSGTGEP